MIVPKRNPEVVWRLEKGVHEIAWEKARKEEEYEDLGVLTLMVKAEIHQLNLVGAEIWTRMNGINTLRKISGRSRRSFRGIWKRRKRRARIPPGDRGEGVGDARGEAGTFAGSRTSRRLNSIPGLWCNHTLSDDRRENQK